MKKQKKKIRNKVMAVFISAAISMNLACSTAPDGYVPEGYVPEGYVPAGYVPEGYISIDDAKALFSTITLPVGYLDGTSEEITKEVGYEVSQEVLQMEKSFVAAESTMVNSRDWSIYTSQMAKEGLTFEEAAFYDRLDEMCRRYMDNAALDGVRSGSGGSLISDVVPFGDLNLTKDQAVSLAFWFKYNNPQYYFIISQVVTTSDRRLGFCIYDFAADGEERAKITNELFNKLDGWIESANNSGMSTWDKEYSANNLLCKNIVYNDEYVENEDLMGQTLYSAVMLEGTVCAGYAAAFCAMMNASGIDTAVALSPTHAWNVVRYDDGNYYAVDVTWNDNENDDDNPNNGYFNVGETTLKDTDGGAHTYSNEYVVWSPEISKIDCTFQETSVAVTLGVPQNLRVDGDEDGKLHIAWDPVDEADGYRLEIYNGDMTNKLNSVLLDGSAAAITYRSNASMAVRVRAEGGAGDANKMSEWSEFLCTDTGAAQGSGANSIKLDKPENVKVGKDEARSTSFSWDPVEGADQYEFVLFRDSGYKETWSGSFGTEPSKSYRKLQPETTYYYGVRAMKTVDGQDYYSDWNYFSHKTPAESAVSAELEKPSAPVNIKTICTGEDKSQTTWDAVPGATGYQVRLYKDSTQKEVAKEFSKTAPKLSLAKLKKGATYYFAVRAVRTADDQEVCSDWVPFTYTHTGEAGSDELSAPTNIKTVSTGEDTAQITWNEVPGATEYQIRSYKDSTYQEVRKENSKTDVKQTISKLKKGTTYYLDIRAVRTAGDQEVCSDWVRFSYTHTGEEGSDKPAAPTNIKTACTGEDESLTTWDEVPKATEYQVRLYKDSTQKEVWKEFSKTAPRLSLTKLKKGTTYYFAVRAVGTAGDEESCSDWVSFTYTHTGEEGSDKPAAPANIKTVCTGEDAMQATWDEVPGATEYQLRLYKDSTYGEVWKESSKTAPKTSATKLQKGTTYYFAIRTVKTDGDEESCSDWVRFSYTHTGEIQSD